MTSDAYRAAGVDIDAQDRALARVKKLVKGTRTAGVLSELGGFGGMFRAPAGDSPVLVASADGVGTKLAVARLADDFSTVGHDLVNHCVNDILVQGARPLFFMDYVGTGRLEADKVVQLVEGVASGCRENRCALLGGETAEMPGFYAAGDYDLVGFIVGAVEEGAVLGPSRVEPGDLLVGLPSSGLHTNGYSLARRILFDRLGLGIDDRLPGMGKTTVRQALLAVHRSYLRAVEGLLAHPALHAMAHVTGGGLTDNLPRALPRKTHAVVRLGTWEIPPLFHLLQDEGEVDGAEMLRVFNMGIGMVLVVGRDGLREVLAHLRARKTTGAVIGTVEKGGAGVVYDVQRSAERPAEPEG